jgi:hypothetical protein
MTLPIDMVYVMFVEWKGNLEYWKKGMKEEWET